MSDFDKEEFLRQIHTFGSWVRTGDDLMKYCKHLQYRLLQSQAVDRWYQKNVELTEDQHHEVNKIVCSYDQAYNNDTSEFQPFKEVFTT